MVPNSRTKIAAMRWLILVVMSSEVGTLALSAEQDAELDALSKEYNARADSALTPLLNWVLREGKRVFDRDLGRRLSAAQSVLGRLNTEYSNKAQGMLTAEQLNRYRESTSKKEK